MHDSTAYTPPPKSSAPKSFLRRITLSQWIIVSMVVGILVGWLFPDSARDVHHGWAASDLNVLSIGLPADDQVVDRPAAVRDARRRHRGARRRHEARRPAGACARSSTSRSSRRSRWRSD